MQTDTFKDKVVIVTGGASGIGRCIADEFRKQGAVVYVVDKQEGDHFVGDIARQEVLEAFATEVLGQHARVDVIVNNALPLMRGIDECSYEEFQYALSVGVTAPFYLVKLLKEHLAEGASIINISSSRDRMSQPQTESYTAAKGGHCRAHARLGREPVGAGEGQLHLSRMDRHGLHRVRRSRRHATTCRPRGQSHGHCPHGVIPL